MNPSDPVSLPENGPRPGLAPAILTAILFFWTATVFGVLEVHSSTDTWIGLAAARQIFELGHVPKNDTFSFTVSGQPWYNQNWLTHVFMYLLYDRLGPAALAIGTWCTSATIFLMTMLATFWRTRSWLAAWIAGGLVAIGSRDFLSARPSTFFFFCIAALAMLLAALEGQRERVRWWPIALLFPLLVIWGNAHGSFDIAYVLLAIYLTCWAAMHFLKLGRVQIRPAQAYAIAGVTAAALLMTLFTGPFGLSNFIHPGKVLGSSVWRGVSEWTAPYDPRGNYPPMDRYWWIIATLAATTPALGITVLLMPTASAKSRVTRDPSDRGWRLFDLIVMAIGFGFSIWARRFAPMFYIFAAPVFARWAVMLIERVRAAGLLDEQRLIRLRWTCAGVLLILTATTAGVAWRRADVELVKPFATAPDTGLLERVTRYDLVPDECVQYLARNELDVRLFTEWTLAGIVMFKAPVAKVLIDGRAQQVYDLPTYYDYQKLFGGQPSDNDMRDLLNRYNVNCLLLRPMAQMRERGVVTAFDYAERSSDWVPLLYGRINGPPFHYGLFLRVDDPHIETLVQRIVDGKEWRPDTAEAWATRAQLLLRAKQPQFDLSIQALRRALEMEPRFGIGEAGYKSLVRLLVSLGRVEEAQQYVDRELIRRRTEPPNLNAKDRESILRALNEARKLIPGPPGSAPAAQRP